MNFDLDLSLATPGRAAPGAHGAVAVGVEEVVMIDGKNLGRIPVGEARRLYARMIGRAGNMWLGVGRLEKTAEGLDVRWDEDGRAAAPAWELTTGRWPEGNREVVEFGVIEQGRMLRIARCRLTGWAVRESRWGR